MKDKTRSVQLKPIPRKSVLRFASVMEKKLRGSSRKCAGGWHGCDTDMLIDRLKGEVAELEQLLSLRLRGLVPKYTEPHHVAEECADIANYAMMIADNECLRKRPAKKDRAP